MTMGAGKLRVFAVRGGAVVFAAAVAAALAAGCGSVTATPPGAGAGRAARRPRPSVPELGTLTLGSFPATSGRRARRRRCASSGPGCAASTSPAPPDTPFQLEVWFSTAPRGWPRSPQNSPLKSDPSYIEITTRFGLASTAAAASIANARALDKACAAAD